MPKKIDWLRMKGQSSIWMIFMYNEFENVNVVKCCDVLFLYQPLFQGGKNWCLEKINYNNLHDRSNKRKFTLNIFSSMYGCLVLIINFTVLQKLYNNELIFNIFRDLLVYSSFSLTIILNSSLSGCFSG